MTARLPGPPVKYIILSWCGGLTRQNGGDGALCGSSENNSISDGQIPSKLGKVAVWGFWCVW